MIIGFHTCDLKTALFLDTYLHVLIGNLIIHPASVVFHTEGIFYMCSGKEKRQVGYVESNQSLLLLEMTELSRI